MDTRPVLVVDDDPEGLVVVQTLLKEVLGVASVPATDAAEALTVINKVKPRLILLDLRIPGPNSSYEGLTVARRVKSDVTTRHIPVVAFSGLSDGRELAEEAGCEDFIEKPFDVDTFVRVVQRHLHRGVGLRAT